MSGLIKALEALHVAASAIKTMPEIVECTVDNDHQGGEIIFMTEDGREWVLKLAPHEQ